MVCVDCHARAASSKLFFFCFFFFRAVLICLPTKSLGMPFKRCYPRQFMADVSTTILIRFELFPLFSDHILMFSMRCWDGLSRNTSPLLVLGVLCDVKYWYLLRLNRVRFPSAADDFLCESPLHCQQFWIWLPLGSWCGWRKRQEDRYARRNQVWKRMTYFKNNGACFTKSIQKSKTRYTCMHFLHCIFSLSSTTPFSYFLGEINLLLCNFKPSFLSI